MTTRIRDVEITIRRVRWFAVVFAIAQFLLFEAGPRADPMPFERLPTALVFAGLLTVTNLVSHRLDDVEDDRRVHRFGLIETAIDTGLVVALLWLFGFDPDLRLWPLLTFPVLEGAMRAQLPGALAVWLVGSIGYGAEQIVHQGARGDPLSLTLPAVTFAAFILLFIALATGLLARRLAAAEAATLDEQQRLRRLAELGVQLTGAVDPLEVHRRFVDAACELTGYEYAALLERGADGRWSRRAARGGDPTDTTLLEPELVPAYDELVAALDRPQRVELNDGLLTRVRTTVPDIQHLVAAPVLADGTRIGLLLLGATDADPALDDATIALLDLLAAHASASLRTARLAATRASTIAELERLDELKSDFLSILSHELRSPMTALAGYAEILAHRGDSVGPEKRAEFIEGIRANTQRLTTLIGDVHDALRAERTELPVDIEPVDLAPLLERAAEQVTASPKHTLLWEIPDDLPKVSADAHRVAQILDNLVSNACKYSPDGGRIHLRARVDAGAVTVDVQDEGLGLDTSQQRLLFSKFVRLHPGRGIPGTGLGLYLSRTLTEAMGGELTIASTVGVGSTFSLRLPVVPSGGDAPAPAREAGGIT